jgi:gliding motility-associated-like protein
VEDTAICLGASVQLHATGGEAYAWQPAAGISALNTPDPVVNPPVSTWYIVSVSNACGAVLDSAFVEVHAVSAAAWPDTVVCPNERLVLHASGGSGYLWSPGGATSDSLVLDPAQEGTFTVVASDVWGCSDTAQVEVGLFPPASVGAGYTSTVDYGDSVQLHAFGTGSFLWSPDSTLGCSTCPDPFVWPTTTTVYTVELTDGNGCKATSSVTVFFRGTLFVPNTFTPNNDGINDRFLALATEVDDFRMLVYNRWGQLIFETDRLGEGWDGRYKGHESPIDTYVWRVDLREANGSQHTLFGHVNLVR